MSSAKSKIITLPHPALRIPSRRIGLIDDSIHKVQQELLEQAILWEKSRKSEITVGLAGVQINKPIRIIIIRQSIERGTPAKFDTLINPKILKLSGQPSIEPEGCLSVDGYYANVARYPTVKVIAQDLNGRPIKIKAQGFLARILQHECDHLKGITIVDRAVKATNDQGQPHTFCRLTDTGGFEVIDKYPPDLIKMLKHD